MLISLSQKARLLQGVHSLRESTLECGVCYAYAREPRENVVRPYVSFIMSLSPSTSITTARPVFLRFHACFREKPHPLCWSLRKSSPSQGGHQHHLQYYCPAPFFWSLIKSSPSQGGHQFCLPHFREAWV